MNFYLKNIVLIIVVLFPEDIFNARFLKQGCGVFTVLILNVLSLFSYFQVQIFHESNEKVSNKFDKREKNV